MTTNRQWILASRPQGEASVENFRLVSTAIARPEEGEVLVRNQFMSLDPYMRGRMDESKSYAAPQALERVMDACERDSVFGFDEDRNLKLRQAMVEARRAGVGEGALSNGDHLVQVERFGQVLKSTLLVGRHCAVQIRMGGGDDHRYVGVAFAHTRQ